MNEVSTCEVRTRSKKSKVESESESDAGEIKGTVSQPTITTRQRRGKK